MWLSVLCASNRPNQLNKWLDSLYENCYAPKEIELSLVVEKTYHAINTSRWGNVRITIIEHGQYNINQLQELAYAQSTSPFVMLSGDDTICHTRNWDKTFINEIEQYNDKIVLVYPNDTIFGRNLACYPVTSREVMDKALPVPYQRYAIDDTIFDIVPRSRRIYFENVIFEHLHLRDYGPGHPVMKDGKQMFYPINEELMKPDRELFVKLQPVRDNIRMQLEMQINGKLPETRVMICLPTAEFARRADFYDYFNGLFKPEGTMIATSHGQSPARNRNIMIRTALEQNATHCFFLDDDMAFDSDTLVKLLKHDKDIVSGLYLMRNYPHLPVMFDQAFDDGKCKFAFLEQGKKGLVEAVNVGLGCALIKTNVFRKMTDPWITLGECERDHWSDDISFFNRARKDGFKIYVDLETTCSHMITAMIRPLRDEFGNWFTTYNTGSPEMFKVPQQVPTAEQVIAQMKQEGYEMAAK
jgi:hypothetical protein